MIFSKICNPLLYRLQTNSFNLSNTAVRQFKTVRNRKPLTRLTAGPAQGSPVVSQGQNSGKNLIKCTIFAAGVCLVSYSEAALSKYERLKNEYSNQISKYAEKYWNEMDGWKIKQGDLRKEMNRWWNENSEGHKAFWKICFVNTVIFGCWRFVKLQPYMLQYFTFNPASKVVCWPMILSTFSHYNLFHLGANMFVLHSFSGIVCHKMGYEDFLAFYISAGVLSSLGSAFVKTLTSTTGGSLGASGAILGLLGYFCTKFPNAELGILFVPGFKFSAESAVWALVAFDLAGIIFRFKLFDHGAHLAGTMLGIFYAKYGEQMWLNQRGKIWQYLESIDQRTK